MWAWHDPPRSPRSLAVCGRLSEPTVRLELWDGFSECCSICKECLALEAFHGCHCKPWMITRDGGFRNYCDESLKSRCNPMPLFKVLLYTLSH